MALSDKKLMSFSVGKPWAKFNAELHSPVALESWEYENPTPALDEPPDCPRGIPALFEVLFQLLPCENSDFDQDLWGEYRKLRIR